MTFDIEGMKAKVLLMANPNSGYTQKDFNEEFGGSGLSNIESELESYKFKFEFVNNSTNEDPAYATDGSSGFDLRANLERPILIHPHEREVISTGLFFKIPPNFEIQIRPRSGLAAKNGITVLNSPGTIDADYRGEIKVILINHSDDRFLINHGDRIAQAVIATVTAKNVIDLVKVENISTDTNRGTGGFGSTGTA